MLLKKVSFGNFLIFALTVAEVACWTIDLPEVRRFYFEKNEMERKHEDYNYNKNEREQRVYYNNIEGNSKHNTKHDEGAYGQTAYATEYGYQSYMEKKVNNIVYHGSVYLEGLRRALEDFSNFLESCNRTASNETTLQNSTRRNETTNSSESVSSRCREASKRSEHVRRLSALATWATTELQDIAYARKYNKGDYHELAKEENELILKLAWFLDRLASLTGYEPEPRDFLQEQERSTTSTSSPPPMIMDPPPSEENKRAMMECLQRNSSVPAVDRCRYRGPLPPIVGMLMDMNNNTSNMSGLPAPSNVALNPALVIPMTSESRTSPVSDQSMEILIASANRAPILLPPILTAVRSVQKRFVSSMVRPEVKRGKFKRSIEDPAVNFLKYYAKHKVWEASNPKRPESKSFEEFEVKNGLTHRQKRAIKKKFQHFRVPEDPFQDISNYAKHKPGVNYVKDLSQAAKIREAMKKMHDKISKHEIRKLAKLLRQRRYVEYEKDVDKPRESVDPQGDISYYVKNKKGRNYSSDQLQAAQLRAGLQQIFASPNIEVVRRFGANYNPAIPDPFMFGVMRTMADF